MTHRSFAALAGLLLPLAAHAAPVGFVDGISAAGASGWACVPGAGPASVAALAGDRLLGIFPTGSPRPDAAPICGSANAGFSVAFDAATQAQLAGEPSLLLFALAPGAAPVPLRGSNPGAFLPYALPAGALTGIASGQVTGSLTAPNPPNLQLATGAPAANGGVPSGDSFAITSGIDGGRGFGFALPLPDFTPPPGGTLPLFGYAADAPGIFVPLANPLVAGAQAVSLPAHVAQSGALAGIRNTLFTAWIPPGQGFAGVTGRVSLGGNAPGFSEALLWLSATADSEGACQAENGEAVGTPPPITRLWAAILKNTAAATSSIPVAIALPYPVPPPGPAGFCAMALVSAGYAYLTGPGPMYAVTDAALTLATVPVPPGAATVIPVGIGGEFRFPLGTPAPLAVYVGLMASRPLHLDAIAASLAASPVVNAPAGSPWLPVPAGNWNVGTTFYALPAASCAAAHLQVQPSNGVFSILRRGTPAPLAVPAGAINLFRVSEPSLGGFAIEKSAYEAFTSTAPGGRGFTLAPGDCLLGWEWTASVAGATPGMLDVEDQSTIYLRPF